MTRPGKIVLMELWCTAAAWRYVVIGACACTLLAFVFPPRLSPVHSSYTRPQPFGNAAGGPVAPPIPTGQAIAPGSAAATTGMARTSSNPGATAAAGPTVPKIKPGAPIEGVEETAASPGLQAELMGEVKADTLPGATAATGPTIAKIKPGAPIEEVEETAASPGLQAELVGEAKADTPVGGRINPSQPIAPGVHRIKSGSLVEDADEVPPPPAR